jgi:hypothetical protein
VCRARRGPRFPGLRTGGVACRVRVLKRTHLGLQRRERRPRPHIIRATSRKGPRLRTSTACNTPCGCAWRPSDVRAGPITNTRGGSARTKAQNRARKSLASAASSHGAPSGPSYEATRSCQQAWGFLLPLSVFRASAGSLGVCDPCVRRRWRTLSELGPAPGGGFESRLLTVRAKRTLNNDRSDADLLGEAALTDICPKSRESRKCPGSRRLQTDSST